MTASTRLSPSRTEALVRASILRILDENRTMTVATARPDGWPQATIVGYIREDWTLYCAVSRNSQKLANIRRDPRTSIAIGGRVGRGARLRGLSMAALVREATDRDEIIHVNELVWLRFPDFNIFAPHEEPSVVLRVTPQLISVTDSLWRTRSPQRLDLTGQPA
jgi:hypothetical protein